MRQKRDLQRDLQDLETNWSRTRQLTEIDRKLVAHPELCDLVADDRAPYRAPQKHPSRAGANGLEMLLFHVVRIAPARLARGPTLPCEPQTGRLSRRSCCVHRRKGPGRTPGQGVLTCPGPSSSVATAPRAGMRRVRRIRSDPTRFGAESSCRTDTTPAGIKRGLRYDDRIHAIRRVRRAYASDGCAVCAHRVGVEAL